jgi:hypothetical protein
MQMAVIIYTFIQGVFRILMCKVNNLKKSISIAILKKSAFQSLLGHLGRKPPVTQLIIYPKVRTTVNGKLTFVG